MGEMTAQSSPRVARSRIPIIALTAHSMKGDCERCLAAMDAFVTKSIRASELLLSRVPAAQHLSRTDYPDTNDQLFWVVYFAIYAVPSAVLESPRIASSSRLIR